MEERLLKKGDEFRANNGLTDDQCLKLFDELKISDKKKMNSDDIEKGKLGDKGQGERLYSKKK